MGGTKEEKTSSFINLLSNVISFSHDCSLPRFPQFPAPYSDAMRRRGWAPRHTFA